MDDSKLIELFFARSEQAITELSAKYGGLCRKVALNILNDPEDAEECVNDAYLGVWNSIPPWRPESLSAYVCRIVRNLAIKRYHMNRTAKRDSSYDIALDELETCFPSSDSVEAMVDANELTRAINDFLSMLDKDSRILFVRRYWYADSIEDLAARFQTSRHNISVRLNRIRGKLRQHLLKEGISV